MIRVPTLSVRPPPAPFAYNRQDARQAFMSLLSEASKNENGSLYKVKKSDKPLVLVETWSGHTLEFHNQQEPILVIGSIIAYDTILLENIKGDIIVDGSIVSFQDISVKIDRGKLAVRGICMAADNTMTIEASNSPLQLQCMLGARKLNIKLKHAPLVLNQVTLIETLRIRATETSVEVHIVDIKNSSANIDIETSYASVTVYLSRQFYGKFNIESKGGIVSIINNSRAGILDYKLRKPSHIEGYFKHRTSYDHSIVIKTSLGPVTLHIV